MSFYHNVFAREHNLFVEAFRKQGRATPAADSGLRNPARPEQIIRYQDVTPDELFEVARLVVSAEIAKIHTIEWTPQLLYDEPLYLGMNSNWSGLFEEDSLPAKALERSRRQQPVEVHRCRQGHHLVLGIRFGPRYLRARQQGLRERAATEPRGGGPQGHLGSAQPGPRQRRYQSLSARRSTFRRSSSRSIACTRWCRTSSSCAIWSSGPDVIRSKVPVVATFRGRATAAMREDGLADWGLSMGRQRLGALTLQNHAQFLQNLTMQRLDTPTKKIDVVALDLIRDRERGIPRFNEFRRQYGLKQLRSFDDFVDRRLPEGSAARKEQERLVAKLREVYGQHRCDASKVITRAQLNDDGTPINDCLGYPDGTMVDNIEDVDTVVGWLAEFTRPHGFAISETQFQVFILNASRRLFSDRFFTSSFRPEFYSHLGVAWVNDNGPRGKVMEKGLPNGHEQEVSPLKRVLLRTIPELTDELGHVVNVFDPWARDRGEYYSLEWKPRPGAEADEAF